MRCLIIGVLLLSGIAQAETTTTTTVKASALEGRRIQRDYRERLAFEQRFKNGIQRICRHVPEIENAAKVENISPRFMIGCLLSEHTYLVNAVDDAVDIAAAFGIYDDPSIGLAQIKLSTARKIAPQLYNRSVPDDVIINDLLNPRVAPHYMAYLIRDILNNYEAAGFDLTNSIGLVCSSYLVGNSRMWAFRHKKNGTSPGVNYYGAFAMKHQQTITNILSGSACR